MSYAPTMKDLQNELPKDGGDVAGYHPSSDDLQGILKDKQPSMLQRFGKASQAGFGGLIGKDIPAFGLGALQGISDIGQGIGQLEAGGVNKIAALLGHPTHLVAPKGDVFYGPAAKLKGTLPANIGELAGQVGGYAAIDRPATAIAKLYGLAPRIADAVAGGFTGATLTPGGGFNRGVGAALGSLAPSAGRGISKAYKAMKTIPSSFEAAKKLEPTATKILKGWTLGTEKGDIPSDILDSVRKNKKGLDIKYSGIRDKKGKIAQKGLFDLNQDLARKKGYIDEPMIHQKAPKKSVIILPDSLKTPPISLKPTLKPGAKAIIPIKSDPILKNMAKTGIYKDIGLKGLISDYLKQPSFAKAHELQSFVGKELQNYKAGTTKFSLTQFKELNSAKESILDDIKNSMIKNKDNEIYSQYKNLRQGFHKELGPYRNDAPLLNTIEGKTGKETIINTLLSGKHNTDKVLGDLMPSVRRKLFAGKLSDSVFSRDESGKLKIDAHKLVKGYDSLEEKKVRGLKDVKTESEINYLRKLIGVSKTSEKVSKVGKKVGKGALLGIGGVAGGYLPYHFLKSIL